VDRDQFLGRWWFAEQADEKLPGILRRRADGTIELELLTKMMEEDRSYREIIYGLAGGKFFSLCSNVSRTTKYNFAAYGERSEIWEPSYVFENHELRSKDETFRVITFTIDGLQEWSRISGITKKWTQYQQGNRIEHEISRSEPEAITLLMNGYEIHIRSTFNSTPLRWGQEIREGSQVWVQSNEGLSMDEWRAKFIHPFRRLVQFATKTGGDIAAISVEIPNDNSSIEPKGDGNWIKISSNDAKKYPKSSDIKGIYRPLFTASDLAALPDSLNEWFGLYNQFPQALDALLDLDLAPRSMEETCFVTSRLLERLCERFESSRLLDKATRESILKLVEPLLSNENREEITDRIKSDLSRRSVRIPLSEMIREWSSVLEPLKSSPEIAPWVASLFLNTRNCFAHHDPDTCMKAARGLELRALASLVRGLVDVEISSRIGLTPIDIAAVLDDTGGLNLAKLLTRFFEKSKKPDKDVQSFS